MADCCGGKNVSEKPDIGNAVKVNGIISIKDKIGSWKSRWSIGRMNYKVNPGLYLIGEPGADSEVFISSNYKMSFDILRKNLNGLNAWIIVLDTKGINVWCAAGKGTFGTEELIKMVDLTGIKDQINHKRLIVPQLGAPGISAHEVAKRSGMKVIYGPVKASDIKSFLKNNRKATSEMRKVTFPVWERLILTPTELIHSLKYSPILFIILFLIDIVIGNNEISIFYSDIIIFAGALLTGTVLFPLFLPIIPVRSFVLKGWIIGLIYILLVDLFAFGTILGNYVHLIMIPPLISFLAYNFTGSTTFTNLSGVEKELKLAIPAYTISGISGLLILVLKLF